jgi:hypothetical protein
MFLNVTQGQTTDVVFDKTLKEVNENEYFYNMLTPKGCVVRVSKHKVKAMLGVGFQFTERDEKGQPIEHYEEIVKRERKEKKDPSILLAETIARLVEQGEKRDSTLVKALGKLTEKEQAKVGVPKVEKIEQ